MKITKRQLRKIIREEQADVTPKYDKDSALIGGQSRLSDPLQKAIIDKTVEDREEAKEKEAKEKEAKEKSESIRITKTQLQQIIKEEGYYADLPKQHIDGQVWGGSLEGLAYHQGRTWGHGDVVDPKGFKGCVQKGQRLAQGKDGSPLQITEVQLRRIIREAIDIVDPETGEVFLEFGEDGDYPDAAWPELQRRLNIQPEKVDPDGTAYVGGDDRTRLEGETVGKREDRATAAHQERLDIDNLLARLDRWGEDAARDFLADNPGADMGGLASDLAKSVEFEFAPDEWQELVWHFEELADYHEDGEDILFTYVADRLAG